MNLPRRTIRLPNIEWERNGPGTLPPPGKYIRGKV